MMKKLFIPFKDYNYIGGPPTFMKNLRDYLDKNHFSYTNSPDNASAIFFSIQYDFKVIEELKNRGGMVIQRLDGVYYPEKHGKSYKDKNKLIKKIYFNYADFVVFQSEYSRKQCFTMFGEKNVDSHEVIINGTDINIFYPSKRNKLGKKIKFITTGNFRNIDMLEPIIQALDELEKDYSFELSVVGPVMDKRLSKYLKKGYLKNVGEVDRGKVAGLLRQSDIFLYSHLNPPCPNSVLEAVSCGLPVVGFGSGAMSELLPFSKELLVNLNNKLFHSYDDFDYIKLKEKIELSIKNFSKYKHSALKNSSRYSFEECGEKYVEVFENILKIRPDNYEKDNLIEFLARISYLPLLVISKLLNPARSLEYLFNLDKKLYLLEGIKAREYGGGVHTKHKHIKYHEFFTDNISKDDIVLDIGSGDGSLTLDMAKKADRGKVVGVDILKANVKKAKEKHSRKNINYVNGDITKTLPNEKFTIVVLSNVLEHIEKRVQLLTKIKNKYKPVKILIRVPSYERDWRVPLKDELGLDYRLDETHCIEYTQEKLLEELESAGFDIKEFNTKWGEYWVKATI